MDYAIQTHGLTKTFHTRGGRKAAVDSLDMAVPRGGVHGFLGPNGAGKTTTLRILVGLARADEGTATVLGHPVPRELPEALRNVGVIVESPHFFDAFSARRNLELLAGVIGAARSQVDEALTRTHLLDRADDLFKTYSLGMKQRLAIAAALLKDPEILIFDEPTNGLDPQGIHEIRETIRGLGASGHTVLVSSHILSEVEQFADTVTIIGRGRTVAEGTIDSIRASQRQVLEVGVTDASAVRELLSGTGLSVTLDNGLLLVDDPPPADQLNRYLAGRGVYVSHLQLRRSSLEEAFLGLTESVAVGEMSGPRHSGGGTARSATARRAIEHASTKEARR